MGGNIKGITIEFQGNTTKLDQALKDIDKKTASIDKELRAVNNGLKFSPKSVELLSQKQTLLKQKIQETKTKLESLKQAQKKLDDDPSVDKTSEDYRELQREIVTTESKLKTFNGQLMKVGSPRLTAMAQTFKEVGAKMMSVGRTMTTSVTLPIVAGYTAASKYASDYEENLNKLDVAFGKNSKSVKEWAKTAKTEFGLSQVQATQSASAFGALGKGIGLTEQESAKMSTTLAGLSADLGSYFNVGVDESAKALEGIFTGESEALKKFGVVMTDTNLKEFAADQNLVWSEMSQGEKTMLRYQYVLAKTKDAQGDFSRTSDGTANSIKVFQASVQDLMTAIGTQLLPLITPVIQKITEWINKFNELSPATQKVIAIVGIIVAALGPVITIIGAISSAIGFVISAISAVSGAISAAGGVIAALSGPIGWVIAALAALVAGGIAVYKNWDKIKAAAAALGKKVSAEWNKLKAKTKAVFTAIKTIASTVWSSITSTVSKAFNKITSPVKKAVETVRSAISKIKRILSGTLKFPKIKLPHFSFSGKFSLNPPSVPKFNVSWYKTGGIFNSPTIAGIGEAGPEAVVPLDTLWNKLDGIKEAAAAGGGIVMNIYATPGMDTNELADKIQQRLVLLQKQKVKAWGY